MYFIIILEDFIIHFESFKTTVKNCLLYAILQKYKALKCLFIYNDKHEEAKSMICTIYSQF